MSRVPGKAFFNGPVFSEVVDMTGKRVLITGANTGIGLETVKGLAERGAEVILACRDQDKAREAILEVQRHHPQARLSSLSVDLADLQSIRTCTEQFYQQFDALDILINNAGVMRTPLWRTPQNLEIQMGVNHVGHFLLTNLLLPALHASSGNARVVHVSSRAHERARSLGLDDLNWEKKPYSSAEAYNRSKLANVLFSNELNRRCREMGIYSNALHPGVVRTDLARYMMQNMNFIAKTTIKAAYPVYWYLLKDAFHGAQTTLYCACSPELEGVGGKYFSDLKEKMPNRLALDEDLAHELWSISEEWVGESFHMVPKE